ncbi:MAG: hypothetical protein IJD92_01505 [Bacilli bacterium]|nr:hypothetical protein [Bacilli bacterium]
MKKTVRIIIELIISLLLTLLIFYMLSWYSFNTLPTKVVFIRMIIMTLIIFDLILLIFHKKDFKRKK